MNDTDEEYTPFFSNRSYDLLKYIALVGLPALSALYFGLGQIWDLPKVTEVIGTIAVLDTVLGTLLRTSNVRYKSSDARFDGRIEVIKEEENVPPSINIDDDTVEALEVKNEVLLKVSNNEAPLTAVEVIANPLQSKQE